MTTEGGATSYVGRGVRRREDPRLLKGRGLFVADVRLSGLAHAAVLRSPHAHARIPGMEVERARSQPGVLAALSFADLGPDPPKLPMLVPHKALRPQTGYPLARDRVRYVGEPVAVVVAESPYLAEVARLVSSPPPSMKFPEGLEPGLEATHYYHPTANTFGNGVHAAVVEVDAETGRVCVLRYAVVHDCGTVINPVVVDGQVRGGVAQGLGNALYEEIAYDRAGQPLTTSYLDYLLPTAMEVPPIDLGHLETPSPLNPEGIKGAGEGGTMPVPAAIANAIDDALAPLGVVVERAPLGPAQLRALIVAATAGRRNRRSHNAARAVV